MPHEAVCLRVFDGLGRNYCWATLALYTTQEIRTDFRASSIIIDMVNIIYRLSELFSGPGGIALGAKAAKLNVNGFSYSISHVWATDYDKDTCDTYRYNICPENPKSVICKDIRKLDLEKLAEISPIAALAFGFPHKKRSK